MATEEQPALTVVYAAKAISQLDDIWEWNNSSYGADHADSYLHFLQQKVTELTTHPYRGKPLPSHPTLRYSLMRRRSKGHGHVVVYRLDRPRLNVLSVFHSAQDWQKMAVEEAE